MTQPRMRLSATVLGAPDARALAAFYEQLLGWTRVADEPDWVMLRPPSGGTGLSFQSEPDLRPPGLAVSAGCTAHDDPSRHCRRRSRSRGWPGRGQRARGSPTSSRSSTCGSCSTRSGIRLSFPRPRLTAGPAPRGAPTACACMRRGPWGASVQCALIKDRVLGGVLTSRWA